MVKTPKNLQNQESFMAESWIIASGLKAYKACSNDDYRLNFYHFTVMGQFASLYKCMGKILKNHFFRNVLKTNG